MKKEYFVIAGICILFVCISVWMYMSAPTRQESEVGFVSSDSTTVEQQKTAGFGQPAATSVSEEIAVYICGAVHQPGFYRLPTGSRVYDAITAAGGLKKSASQTAVNQARALCDGEQIQIPTKKQQAKSTEKTSDEPTASTQTADGLININTAEADELMTLLGIGKSKASMILEYRTSQGSFQKIEDIMQISGIKEGVFNQIKKYITV